MKLLMQQDKKTYLPLPTGKCALQLLLDSCTYHCNGLLYNALTTVTGSCIMHLPQHMFNSTVYQHKVPIVNLPPISRRPLPKRQFFAPSRVTRLVTRCVLATQISTTQCAAPSASRDRWPATPGGGPHTHTHTRQEARQFELQERISRGGYCAIVCYI